ncbi:MAG: T9SS type A sorting domain-containing protein [Bacteroidales bacterium]|nr:T9SS type A sorting domain-containing protein [Bacteroidales bacterium]
MKKSLLLTFALLLSMAVFSQTRTTFVSEHFDGSTMPSGWTIKGSGASNWSVSATENAGGSANEMMLYWDPQFNGTSRLCTPAVDLTGISSVVVSFKHALDNYQGAQVLSVCTSSDGGTIWNEGWTQNYSSNGSWAVSQNIATSDMGQSSVMFGITFTGNSYNINNWYFDDIEVFSMEQLDLCLSSIDVSSVAVAGMTDVNFTVMNKGENTINEFVVSYQVDENEVVEETFNTSLASLQTAQYTFAVPMELLPGSYVLNVNIESVNGSEDSDLTNNTLEKAVSVALGSAQRISMIEHFSSSTCGPCVAVNTAMVALENNNQGKYTYTKYPMSWPGNGDPYYTAEGGTRRTYYGVNAVPQTFLDGADQGYGAVSQTAMTASYATPAYGDVRGSFNVDGNTINVKVDFMAYYDMTVEKAFVTVNEKETHNNVGGNGETTFHHIMMKMLTGANGVALNIPAGECQHIEYSFDMSSTHVEEMSDLEVSAWMQNLGTKEMVNSHFLYDYTDIHPYPVQNLSFDLEDGSNTMMATWEAPEGGNALSYDVYVNGEFVENTTNTSYQTEYTGAASNLVEVVALYPDEKTSVGIVKILVDHAGVVENETVKSIIYPNPTNGNIVVNGKNMNEIQVYNICGQQVISAKANSENVILDLGNFAAGVYMVKVIDNQGNAVVNKVIKR